MPYFRSRAKDIPGKGETTKFQSREVGRVRSQRNLKDSLQTQHCSLKVTKGFQNESQQEALDEDFILGNGSWTLGLSDWQWKGQTHLERESIEDRTNTT